MYAFEQLEDENPLFLFTTDFDLTYLVSFRKEGFENQYFNNLYSVDFSEINTAKNAMDEGVQLTIIEIILNFISTNPQALLHYVCDSTDGRQVGRNKLFTKWFENGYNGVYSKLNLNYQNEEINYNLEFLYVSGSYDIKVLKSKVLAQMDDFSKDK